MIGTAPALSLPQLAAVCPTCQVLPGELCTSHGGIRQRKHDTHVTRTAAWLEAENASIGTDLNRVRFAAPPERNFAEAMESPTLDAHLDETRPAHGQYRVTYERVGRRRDIPPLVRVAAGADHLAELIREDASQYLLAQDVEVAVDLVTMDGSIFCGVQIGGRVTIERLDVAAGVADV